MLITEQARQQEWNIILPIARSNGFPLQIIHNLKNKLILKKQETLTQTQWKKWITFTYYSPLIHKVINLFKSTHLNIAFQACNTIYNQLCDRTPLNKINSSRIYKLQCKTHNKSYVGQTALIKYDTVNIQDISKQITLPQHTHYTSSTTDMNVEIQNKPCNY